MIGRIAFGGRIMNDINLDPILPHSQLTSVILGSCFEVMNELGVGFLESVYKNALFFALREKNCTLKLKNHSKYISKGKK
jgi:hypothetical protein